MISQHSHKHQGQHWLNPLNRMKFQAAISRRQEILVISFNESYKLDYLKREGYVWIQRIGATVPCGWFRLQEVLKPSWILD